VGLSLRERVAKALFGGVIEAEVAARLAAVTARVDDSPGWEAWGGRGPADRPWAEQFQNVEDALAAWRDNFLIRRIVTLTRSYVVSSGVAVSSEVARVDRFVRAFWDHRQNQMARRLGAWCDELTRAGEIFVTLHTNPVDGMSYVRAAPASHVPVVETAENDYEVELRYGERVSGQIEPKWWLSPLHPDAVKPDGAGRRPPVMAHFAVNRVVGATRGIGDLDPVLPWALRYSEWLKDRVRLNRVRTRQALVEIEVADEAVETKRLQLAKANPLEAGMYVHGPGERVVVHDLKIGAGDVADDGRALRLAVATGANVGLHYLGEGESINYATAREMGEPTTRFYGERQRELLWFVTDLVRVAYGRAAAMGRAALPRGDLRLSASVAEVSRADNESLARSASLIVRWLETLRERGWIDDETAVAMAFKFAGEPLGRERIEQILGKGVE
jgi:hypothetical protein